MKVTLTGATGPIGRRLVAVLRRRDDDVTVLTRDPAKARDALEGVEAVGWDPMSGPAPAEALAGRDGVVHLAGESVAQRWNDETRARIHASRETGTRNLVAGLRALGEDQRPAVLVSSSAVGYYGKHGDEVVDESFGPGDDFLARVCVAWEREAQAAAELAVRVASIRTGVVLSPDGGALEKMLPFFKLGVGGPVAGGDQWMPWIHVDDVIGLYVAALDRDGWSGPVNGSAPEPVTNKEFSRRLGKALHRPAFAPVPAFAVRLLYGDMAEIVTEGQRAVPKRPLELGYAFRHPDLDEALRSALGS
jgi:uncharacterized protein (TIGR01777 family)